MRIVGDNEGLECGIDRNIKNIQDAVEQYRSQGIDIQEILTFMVVDNGELLIYTSETTSTVGILGKMEVFKSMLINGDVYDE